MNERLRISLKDLTISKVKAAYKKTGLIPYVSLRGSGCPLQAIAKSRGLYGWESLVDGNRPSELYAFIRGFDGMTIGANTHSGYYRQGRRLAKELIKNDR